MNTSLLATAWYEIATGVIAIPAALLGLLYTFLLSQKARLEAEKLRRELEPTQIAEGESPSDQSLRRQIGSNPIVEGYIIRFILLEVGLQGWSFLVSLASPFLSLMQFYLRDWLSFDGNYGLESFTQAVLFTYLTGFGRWVLFLAIGLPLFIDITRELGLSPVKVLTERIGTPTVRSTAIAVCVLVLSILASILAIRTASMPPTSGMAVLLSRKKYDNYTKATYNFRLATRDDAERTRNKWDIIFGNGGYGNELEVMNEPAEIFDLGEVSEENALELVASLGEKLNDDVLETRVAVHKGHRYLIKAEQDRWAALILLHVTDHVDGDSITMSWDTVYP